MDELASRRVHHAPALDAPSLEYDTVSTVFSSCWRRGIWTVAERIRVRSVFGQVVLDLTDASLPESGYVEIDARVVFGSLKLILPRSAEIALAVQHVVFGQVGESAREPLPARVLRWVTGGDPEPSADDEEPGPLTVRVTGSVVFSSI